jgi:hypothetical protein
MDLQTIGYVSLGSFILCIFSFWLHGRLAKPDERAGPVSMFAFVVGWLAALTAILTGGFWLAAALRRALS